MIVVIKIINTKVEIKIRREQATVKIYDAPPRGITKQKPQSVTIKRKD